jgi:hypothetical protein
VAGRDRVAEGDDPDLTGSLGLRPEDLADRVGAADRGDDKQHDQTERQYTPSGRIASDQLTVRTNAAIDAAARADDATYVDIYTPFEDSADITSLLASDGDHPNAAGHALIARTLLAATPNPLTASPRQGG